MNGLGIQIEKTASISVVAQSRPAKSAMGWAQWVPETPEHPGDDEGQHHECFRIVDPGHDSKRSWGVWSEVEGLLLRPQRHERKVRGVNCGQEGPEAVDLRDIGGDYGCDVRCYCREYAELDGPGKRWGNGKRVHGGRAQAGSNRTISDGQQTLHPTTSRKTSKNIFNDTPNLGSNSRAFLFYFGFISTLFSDLVLM